MIKRNTEITEDATAKSIHDTTTIQRGKEIHEPKETKITIQRWKKQDATQKKTRDEKTE